MRMQLTSNYSSFFEQLTEMLQRIGKLMPRYDEIMQHAQGFVSEPFRKSLENLYTDLLEFVASVTWIFSRGGGSKHGLPPI